MTWDEEKQKNTRKARTDKNKRKWSAASEMFASEKPKQPKRKKI